MDERDGVVHLLLIDDDLDDVLIVRDMLGRHGGRARFEIEAASTEAEAVAALERHVHDVVLVDYQLAGISGLELMQLRASDPARPPFIVLTGHGNADVDELCLNAGAADYLTKNTLAADALVRSIRYALERHRLARLAARREAEYRLLFECSPMPMWVYHPESLRVLDVNEAALALYGYSRDEFLALTLLDLRDPDQHEAFLDYHRNLQGCDARLNAGRWKHRRKDGSAVDVEIVRRDIDVDGVEHRLIVANDVTARVRAETALRASFETMHHLLTNLAEALLVLDQDDRVLFGNPSAWTLLGITEDALVGTPAPEPLRQSTREPVEMFDAQGQVRLLEVRVRETLWHDAPARVVTALDLSERRSSQQRMALLRRAIEASTDGIVLVDAQADDQPLVYVNPAFERMSGCSADEVLGRNCRLLQGDEPEQPALDELREATRLGRHCEVVLRNRRKDGTPFYNRLNISPVFNDRQVLTHFVGVLTDVTEQRRMEEVRRHLETHDALTGLPNYASAVERLDRKLHRCIAEGGRMFVLFLDVDAFHTINDSMDFTAGDAALKALAQRLCRIAGEHALVTRYAGDKFVLGLEDDDASRVPKAVAQTFCDELAQPLVIEGVGVLHLTCSIGISAGQAPDLPAAVLTRQAEFAMHHAKQSGRNTVSVFDQSLRASLDDRILLGRLMRDALARDEFELHYQPQVNAQDGQMAAVEALVRWNSRELGLLMPLRFIHIAEANGLILPIGLALLRSACRQLRQWSDEGFTSLTVCVNISPVQLQRPDFVDDVAKIVQESGIDPSQLELELTESMLMESIEEAALKMRALRTLGVRFALDDFGVGHSSLSYLQQLPLDKLKIDQGFIARVTQNGTDATLVRTMITIGHSLGLRVTAEGVETEAQSSYLRRCRCDHLQGHHFSPPVPAAEITAMLRDARASGAPTASAEPERTLLILDDEDNVRRSLKRLLRRDGYCILEAGSAEEAFELLAAHEVQVVLSDQRMPGISGTEFLSRVKSLYPQTVRLVLSGYTDLNTVTAAINRGEVYKYLTKPWDDEELRNHVLGAFRRAEREDAGGNGLG